MALELAVLIPVYRNQAGLDKSLRSLMAATWPVDGTVIVVDDGSKPEISVNASAWAPMHINLIRLPANEGVESALNAGLEFALESGVKYVARLDAGDTVHQERLARQVSILEDDPSIGIVGSDINFEDEDGTLLFRFAAPVTDREIRRRMHVGLCLIDPTVMFRAAHFNRIGRYSVRYPAAEGYEIAFRFLSVSRAQSIAEALTSTTLSRTGLSLTRRRDQLKSKLRIQLRYFDAAILQSYLGLAATLLLFITPRRAVLKLKQAMGTSGY